MGGVLVGWVGAAPAFGFAAALSIMAVVLLAGIFEPVREPAPRRHPFRDIKEGANFVFRHALLRPVFITQFIFNTASFLILAVFVPYAVRHLGLDAVGVGITLAMYGAGMVVGAFFATRVMRRLRFGTVIALGPITGFVASAVMALTTLFPTPLLAGLSFFLLGAGPILWVISTTTLRQSVTPPRLLGRVSAINIMAYGARPLGAALGALVGDAYGAEACFYLAMAGFGAQALVIVVSSILILVVAMVILAPMLSDQVARFATDLPLLIKTLVQRFDELAPLWIKDAVAQSGADVQGSVTGIAGKAAEWILTLLSTLLSGGMALVNLVSLLVVTPIVAFYLLEDWDHMVAKVDSWLPRDHVDSVRALGRDINTAMAGFIRGQGTVCLLLGTFYAIGLSLAGLKFGLAIGLVAGLLTFIPYAGALFGGALAIGVALVQFWPDQWSILLVVAIFMLGQFLEGNVLSPKLVGKRVGLHPVWLMFALFAFGYAFGFVGLLLAVPMAAAAGVLVRFGLQHYLNSKLYLGTEKATPVPLEVIPKAATKRRSK